MSVSQRKKFGRIESRIPISFYQWLDFPLESISLLCLWENWNFFLFKFDAQVLSFFSQCSKTKNNQLLMYQLNQFFALSEKKFSQCARMPLVEHLQCDLVSIMVRSSILRIFRIQQWFPTGVAIRIHI
jgi:hypothetical protein